MKLNELVSSHETANNSVINAEEKTEREITQLSQEYADLVEQVRELEDELEKIVEEWFYYKSVNNITFH